MKMNRNISKLLKNIQESKNESSYKKAMILLFKEACKKNKVSKNFLKEINLNNSFWFQLRFIEKFLEPYEVSKKEIIHNENIIQQKRKGKIYKRKPLKPSLRIYEIGSFSSYKDSLDLPTVDIITKNSAYIFHKGTPYLVGITDSS